MENREERVIEIREYWHIIQKRRWTIATVLILLVLNQISLTEHGYYYRHYYNYYSKEKDKRKLSIRMGYKR